MSSNRVSLRSAPAGTHRFTGRNARIREATLEDYDKIVALQLRNGLNPRSYADWSALWNDNPAYVQSDGELPMGWVLEALNGEVAGFIGNLVLSYHFNGSDLRATTPHSWAVDEQYRGYSLALLDRFVRQKGVDLFVCTTVNAASETAYRAFGFLRAPVGTWDQAAFWVTGYRGFAGSALRAVSIPLPSVLAYPLSAGLFVRDSYLQAPPGAGSHEFELSSGFDSRFDDFWERLKAQNNGLLLAVRTRETLAWHFRRSLARQSLSVLTACEGGQLVAYAVFDRQDQRTLGLKRLRFVDFQALSGFQSLLRPALGWMLNKCRREGIHVVENVGCWLDRWSLSTAGPYHRKLKFWLFYYKARERDLSMQLGNPTLWAPSSFDGDFSI